MAKQNEITLMRESLRHMGIMSENVKDIWRHEGLKNLTGHGLYWLGRYPLGRIALDIAANQVHDPRLETRIGRLVIKGPTGIAAGADKTGRTIQGWQALGANFHIPGGITKYNQAGNPAPRLWTFKEKIGDHGTSSSQNAYGFNSPGGEVVRDNIAEQKQIAEVRIPIIPQVTLNKNMYEPLNRHEIPTRILETVKILSPVADGFSLGLSSPNTIGMRDAQAEDFLYEIIMPVKEFLGDNKPLELKGDGDGGEERYEMYCNLITRTNLDVISLINSTAKESIKAKYGSDHLPGGLAGRDPEFQQMAVEAVTYVYEAVGDTVDIIGTGGVDPQQAIRLIRAGASALGRVSGIREDGVRTISKIDRVVLDEIELEQARTGKVVYLPNIIGADTNRGPKLKAA